MSRKQLTAKQHAFYEFLVDYLRDNSVWPTYKDIIARFEYRSPNSVTQNLKALHKKNVLRYDQYGYHLVRKQDQRGIPILGLVSAGGLQEAVETHLGTITLETLFPNLERIFALRVSGQSMVGAGIHDGDYVLLINEDIPTGGIGAVLYNGETSLKHIYADEHGLRLKPANPDYDDIVIEPEQFEEVRVLGRFVGYVNEKGIAKA